MWGGRGGLLVTEKTRKKSPKTAKPQEIACKTEIKTLTNKLWYLIFIRLNLFHFPKFFLLIPSLVQNIIIV